MSSPLTRPPADVRELGSRHSASSGSVFRTVMGGRERGPKGEGGSLDQGVKLLQPSGQGWEKRNEGSRKERETESLQGGLGKAYTLPTGCSEVGLHSAKATALQENNTEDVGT